MSDEVVIRIYVKKKNKNEWWDFDDQNFKGYNSLNKSFKKLSEYSDQPGIWHTDIDMGTYTGAVTVVPRNADTGLIAGEIKDFYVVNGQNATDVLRDKVMVDEDYGGKDNLQYVDGDGNPIERAEIRLFTKQNYDAGDTSEPIGTTVTDDTGRWTNNIPLSRGQTYTVHFHKPNFHGPTTVDITVP